MKLGATQRKKNKNMDGYNSLWYPPKSPKVCLMVERIVMTLYDIILNVFRGNI